MVARQTLEARTKKRSERERLISEQERQLGSSADHPEDELILSAGQARPLDLHRVAQIVANLQGGKEGWTCRKVMEAYIRSACAAQRKYNCLTEVMFRDALEQADQKDKDFRATGKAEGAFFGLPSCFKDNYAVKGFDVSLGTSPESFKPVATEEEESAMVRLYRDAGGIVFCKSNVPQTLLSFECSNPIWGKTDNPHDPERTCGGSSGGEAVMVTIRGSPIGWGNDIGGSLRIPAHFSGCCALKPWPGRLPIQSSRHRIESQDAIKQMSGPMARNVSDLIFAAEGLYTIAQKQRDEGYMMRQRVMPIPWQMPELPRKLKVGYFIEEGCVKTSPACARGVHICVDKLRAAGHEVQLITPPPLKDIFKVFVALSSAEGYKFRLDSIGPDPMEPSMQLTSLGSRVPWLLHRLIELIAQYVLGDPIFSEIFAVSGKKSTHDYWAWSGERDNYIMRFFREIWEEGGYDFLLCPVMAVPALEHQRTKFLSPLCIFTVLFNMVDSTVGVLPVTRVDKSLDAIPPDFLASSQGSRILEGRTYSGSDPAYDAGKMHGLPVGVQVVAKPWEEEKVLAMLKLLEGIVGYHYD